MRLSHPHLYSPQLYPCHCHPGHLAMSGSPREDPPGSLWRLPLPGELGGWQGVAVVSGRSGTEAPRSCKNQEVNCILCRAAQKRTWEASLIYKTLKMVRNSNRGSQV